MATEKRLIDANALMEHLERCIDAEKGLFRAVCVAIKCFVEQMPTVEAVEVEDKELLKAIKMLIKQYDHSKQSDYVHSPVAHALFHTWKKVDGGGNG